MENKQQKEYVVGELKRLIREAPEPARGENNGTVVIEVPDSVQYKLINDKKILQEFFKRVERGFKFYSGKIHAFPSKHLGSPKHTAKAVPSLHLPRVPSSPVTDMNVVRKLAEPFASQDPTREVLTHVYWDAKQKSVVATSGQHLFVMKKPRGIAWTGWKTEGRILIISSRSLVSISTRLPLIRWTLWRKSYRLLMLCRRIC